MKKQNGIALLPVAIIITVIAAVSLLLSYESSMNVNETAALNESKQADLVAEAGMAHAKWQLQQITNCTGYTNIPNTNFGTHSYTANINPNSGSPISISANGISSSGVTRALVDTQMNMYQTPFIKEYILDATGKDSFIEGESGHTDHNKGSDQHIKIKSQTDKLKRGLLQFDVSDIPTNSKIMDATLELYLETSNGNSEQIFIHRITNDWVQNEVTWKVKRSGLFQNWFPEGGEYVATISGSFLADTVGWKSAEITQLVQDWVKVPSINQAMILLATPTSGNHEKTFISSDHTDTTRHPKLTVTFACECGQSCLFAGMEPIILSTDSAAVLGGLAFDDIDLVEYDPSADTASLFMDGSLTGIESDIDALHIMENSHILLSMKDDDELGGSDFQDGDLVDYDPLTDIATLFFNENKFSADEDIISVFLMDNGHILMSTDSAATLSGLSFTDKDIVEYDPTTDTATLFFDGTATTLNSDIDALHILSNGNIVLSTKDDATLGGISFNDGDLVIYDPNIDTSAIYLEEGLFNADEDLISAHIGAGSGVGVSDDAEQLLSDGTMYISSSDLELADNLGASSQPTDIVGIRFNNVAIPQGETITNSYIQFQVDELDSGVASLTIEAEAVDNAETFTTTPFNITSRVRTVASVLWSPPVWDTVGERGPDQRTVDLSPVIQEIVDRTGWSSGNSIAFIISGSGTRTAESSEGDPAGAPELHVEFDGGSWSSGGSGAGPMAHWKLDDGVGTTAIDSEGGHDGTLPFIGPAWVAGYLGDALDFDGADDYVDLTSDAELDDVFVGGATVMAWIEPAGWGSNGYGRIFDKSTSPSATGDGWALRVNEDNGGLNFGQGFTGGRGWWKFAEKSINLNIWHHVALVYDASSTANDPIVYLGGSPVAVTRVDTPSGDIRSDAAINLHLGNHASSATTFFDGKIDDARIYDRILDASEIADIAAGGGGGGGGDCKGTYRDEFNTENSYAGTDGTLKWSTDWLEVNESDGADSGDERVRGDSGNDYTLRVRDNDGGGEGVQRESDLSSYTNATLSFDYRRDSLDNSDDYVTIEMSSNGGKSWTEIGRLEGPGDDSSYQLFTHDISSFISNNTRIRFKTSSSNGGSDEYYFDNVEIALSGCAN